MIQPPVKAESTLLGVSVRAWLAVMLVVTVCANSIAEAVYAIMNQGAIAVSEPLKSMALLALGYYFGQKVTKS